MLRGRLKAWGPQVFLDGAAVAYTHTSPNTTGFVQPAHMTLIHLAAEPRWQVGVNSDRKNTGVVLPGSIDIVPANNEASASWAGKKHSLRLDIDPTRLQRLAGAEFDKAAFELQPPTFGFVDKRAHMLALWIKQELENGDAYSLEALDAIVTVYSTYLLRNYSSFHGRSSPWISGGLSPASLRKVKEFVHENIGGTLTTEQLASVARLSPSHFIRAFKRSTGQPPHQFVIAARLARARDLILGTDAPFTLVAISAGFSSHSHMTAQMQRAWGTTPSELRRKR